MIESYYELPEFVMAFVCPVHDVFLGIPAEMPHTGSSLIKGHSDPNLANLSEVSLPPTAL
jgi:hypothetical protein